MKKGNKKKTTEILTSDELIELVKHILRTRKGELRLSYIFDKDDVKSYYQIIYINEVNLSFIRMFKSIFDQALTMNNVGNAAFITYDNTDADFEIKDSIKHVVLKQIVFGQYAGNDKWEINQKALDKVFE